MQTFKFLTVAGVIVLGAGSLSVRAEDTPVQAAARAALEQALSSGETSPATPPAVTATNVAVAKPATPAANVAAPTAKTPAPTAASNVAPAVVPATAPVPTNANVSAPAATADTPEQAAARAALEKTMGGMTAPTIPSTYKAEAPASSSQAMASYPGKGLGLKPITAPPLPITATQEAQLQALLGRYMDNQISPEEYHKQRAVILGQQP